MDATRRRALLLPSGRIGLIVMILLLGLALLGPVFTPGDPNDLVALAYAPPEAGMPLGADALGRDAFVRLLTGGWRIILLSTAATLIGVALGAAAGIFAGYAGRTWDEVLMRLLDIIMALPQIVMALLFISILGPRPWLLVVLIAAVHVPLVARVVRAATLRIVAEDYIRHAEAIGTPVTRIILREILRNVAGPVLVEFGIRFAYSITLFAGLSFLGLGTPPPTPDWGRMINENRIGLGSNPWPVIAPTAVIALLTVSVNLVTDSLSHALSDVRR